MLQITDRIVKLEGAEARAMELFDDYLDRGMGVPVSAKIALQRVDVEMCHPRFSNEFIEYISDGSIIRWGRGYRYLLTARRYFFRRTPVTTVVL